MEASVAQCSPNLYSIGCSTHMQRKREREREGADTGRLWLMVAGESGSHGEIKRLYYLYSLVSLKFKGLEKKMTESKRGRARLTQGVLSCEPPSSLWHRK